MGTSPGLSQGQVPTPGQWNAYFAGKADQAALDAINASLPSVAAATLRALLSQPGVLAQMLASLPTSPPAGGGPFLDNGILTVA